MLIGTKRWITNGSIADVAIVWAKTAPTTRSAASSSSAARRASRARDINGKFSLRASITSELVLEDVRRARGERCLPGVARAQGPFACLNQARYGIVWGAIGAAMACYETALDYAKDRAQFDRPIAGFQLVQQKLVDMITEITKAQLLALAARRG